MKTYRYGLFENILGNSFYVIQCKTWFGWNTVHEFGNRRTMEVVVNQLKNNGHIIYEV